MSSWVGTGAEMDSEINLTPVSIEAAEESGLGELDTASEDPTFEMIPSKDETLQVQ